MTFWLKWQLGGCLCHYDTPVLIFSMFMWIWPSDMRLWFPHDHHIITTWVKCSCCDYHRPFTWSSHDSGMMGHMTITIPTWRSHDHYMSLECWSHDQHMIPMWRSCDQHMIFRITAMWCEDTSMLLLCCCPKPSVSEHISEVASLFNILALLPWL